MPVGDGRKDPVVHDAITRSGERGERALQTQSVRMFASVENASDSLLWTKRMPTREDLVRRIQGACGRYRTNDDGVVADCIPAFACRPPGQERPWRRDPHGLGRHGRWHPSPGRSIPSATA